MLWFLVVLFPCSTLDFLMSRVEEECQSSAPTEGDRLKRRSNRPGFPVQK